MDRTEKILSIIDKLLTLVENKELDEKLDKWVEYMVTEEDEDEELEEGREEVTEHVKDNSPKSLKEENEHLSNLLDSMCELY
jgi:cell shape-determining protein MreC